MGETNRSEDGRLVLLVDHDVESRRHVRHLLELQGMEVVQATNGITALELIQRLPQSFRLVITDLDLPGLSGTLVVETLRIFRPDLPALCMSSRVPAGVDGRGCLPKPLHGPDLEAALRESNGGTPSNGRHWLAEEAVARARARFAAAGDLVEAALELARAADAEEPG